MVVISDREGLQNQQESLILYKRIRIPVKFIYRNDKVSKSLTQFLLGLSGVKFVKANPITAKVLIMYDEKIISEKLLEKELIKFKRKLNKSDFEIVDKINRRKFNEETALPIAIESDFIGDDRSLWHSMTRKDIKGILKTDYDQGLDKEVANERVKLYGLNALTTRKRQSLISAFLENINEMSSKLLLGVSAVSFFLGSVADAVAVLAIVLVETTFGVIQQRKAENSIYSLKDMMVHKARTIRNGKEIVLDAKQLVPGDVILLESGDKVPADARLVQCIDFRTTESSLTGESVPVTKNLSQCDKYSELACRSNMVFMGTNIISGKAKAVVVSTGMNTEIGKIACMLQNIENEATPLQRRMEKFTENLTRICLLFCAGVGGIGLLMGRTLAEVLTLGVSFSVGALPESLPAVVTVTMALSIQRIAKKNAIVRKLNAVETLGSANVICCDKTGTLTMNEMTVKKIYCDDCTYSVKGTGYNPRGSIELVEGAPNKEDTLKKILEAGVLCNNASLEKENDNKWVAIGDPTEAALIAAACKFGLQQDIIREENTRIREIPFDSDRRYMTVIVENNDGKTAYCKGSLTAVLKKCKTIYEDGNERLLTNTDKKKLYSLCEDMADNALRVLAIGYKNISENNSDMSTDKNFVFLGLVGMEDPPREGVIDSISKCAKAGIKVVMITGDNKNTAKSIGKELGIYKEGLVISGSELEVMSDKELDSKIKEIEVFARTSPAQKLRIVKAFKRFGYVVAMTGDGVNDAPAIKEANIGIAMGKNGSDVAKDAADITLLDDDFSTIVSAIEEGRAVSNNIRNTTKYLLAGSLGEITSIFLAGAVGGLLPLVSIQILWTNVICETILGASLAMEPPNENTMLNKPMKKDAPLIDRELGTQIIRRGAGIGITTFGVFQGYMFMGAGLARARTMAFATLISTQMMNVYDSRSNKKSAPNRYMNTATLASALMLGAIIYVPGINTFFSTIPLLPHDLAILGGATIFSRL